MRRARIKAVATVPVRRKATQDDTSVDVSSHSVFEDMQKIHTEESKEHMQKNIEDDEKQMKHKTVKHTVPNEQKEAEKETLTLDNVAIQSNIDVTKAIENQCMNNVVHKIAEPLNNTNSTVETNITSPMKSVQARSCFTRPTPRLDSGGRIRRNSIQGSGASASESEDDSKRTITGIIPNRMRNDSICSVQSTKETANNVNLIHPKSKGSQKRRMLISESARKLAEARREFLMKHQNKTPDRSKLTMYDLIYYNPVTNPMKRSNESKVTAPATATTATATTNHPVRSESRIEEDEEEEEEENDLPVPRVKVGPDGQLIADEQSFVIAQTDTESHKEESIVEDDNTGSGFYTKRQKGKDWPKWETMKFYKALNTVGTDFLLMQSLFPNRSREDIKIKYKKEERTNRNLVEKALTYHQDFDIDALEEELAVLEQLGQNKTVSEKIQKEIEPRDEKKKMCKRLILASINQDSDIIPKQTQETNVLREVNAETNDNRQKKSKKRIKDDENSDNEDPITDKANSEINEVDNDSSSDTEIYHVRPTRSGRLPKVRKLQGPEINSLDNMAEDNSPILFKTEEMENSNAGVISTPENNTESASIDDTASVPNLVHAKPGSIVILSEKLPEDPGKTVLQLYMVDPGHDSSSEA